MSLNNNQWSQSGNTFHIGNISSQVPVLGKGVYSLEVSTAGFYLNRISDEFTFGYKMYGLQTGFIDRVLRTFHATKGNLGMLLNGVKGTGKSVTAKMLANKLELPVILINKGYGGIPDFINEIPQELTIFVDEFEKVYKDAEDGSLLTLMDGVLDNGFRRVFLLTTNKLRINENLLDRPSRIRYKQTYGDLDKATIEEVVDDCLQYPEHKTATISYISKLELITIDIVKAIVAEVNIHNEDPSVWKEVFNATTKSEVYNISYIMEGMDDFRFYKRESAETIEDLIEDPGNAYYRISVPSKGSFEFKSKVEGSDDTFIFYRSNYNSISNAYEDLLMTVKVEKSVSYHHAYLI